MVYNRRSGWRAGRAPQLTVTRARNTVEFTDPRAITGVDWPDLQILVYALWGIAACNFTFAIMMLLSHIVIPSLQATGHVKPSATVARPILTLIALILLAGTVFFVVTFLQKLPIAYDVYPHKLI